METAALVNFVVQIIGLITARLHGCVLSQEEADKMRGAINNLSIAICESEESRMRSDKCPTS